MSALEMTLILAKLHGMYDRLQDLNALKYDERTKETNDEREQLIKEMQEIIFEQNKVLQQTLQPKTFQNSVVVTPKRHYGRMEANILIFDTEKMRCMDVDIRDLKNFADFLQKTLEFEEYAKFVYNLKYDKAKGEPNYD